MLGGEKIRVGRQGRGQVTCIAFWFHFAFAFAFFFYYSEVQVAYLSSVYNIGEACVRSNLNLIPKLIDVTVQRTDYFAISGHPWMDLAFYAF